MPLELRSSHGDCTASAGGQARHSKGSKQQKRQFASEVGVEEQQQG